MVGPILPRRRLADGAIAEKPWIGQFHGPHEDGSMTSSNTLDPSDDSAAMMQGRITCAPRGIRGLGATDEVTMVAPSRRLRRGHRHGSCHRVRPQPRERAPSRRIRQWHPSQHSVDLSQHRVSWSARVVDVVASRGRSRFPASSARPSVRWVPQRGTPVDDSGVVEVVELPSRAPGATHSPVGSSSCELWVAASVWPPW